MGKGGGGKSTGKLLFTAAGFFFGAGGLGQAFFHTSGWLAGGILGASLFGSIWSATHKQGQNTNNGSPNIQRFDKAQETMSSTATIPVVYGFRKLTGNQTFHETNPDQNQLHKHVVLCEGGIEGIESVSANDLIIPTEGQTTHTVFTIQNTKYEDATVRKDGKHLYLHANGETKDLYLANKDDANNADTFWSWQTSIAGLITYINQLGNGWQAFPYATSANYPGDLWVEYVSGSSGGSGNMTYVENVTMDYKGLWDLAGKEFELNARQNYHNANVNKDFTNGGYYYKFVDFWYGEYKKPYYSYDKYKNSSSSSTGGNGNCYNKPVNMQANTVTGGTNYKFYDSVTPENYEQVGGYPKMAWLDMNFMVSSELNGNPSVSCYVKGRKIYDTRTGRTEYSTNPAMCLRDFILSKRYGLGKWISKDNIDEDSFKEAADYCDERIKYTGTSGETIYCKRYELNIIIDQKQSALDWITDILGNFSGFITFSQDRLFLRIEKPESISYKFDDSNCSDLTVTPLSLDDTPNKYEVTFIDPLNNWNSIAVLVEDFADQKARQKIISQEVSLEGTTSQNQALRLARFYRDYNAICYKTVSFKTGQQAMHLEPGDVISLSYHKVFINEPFRITEIKENNDGTFEIAGRSYNPNLYNDLLGATLQTYSYVNKGGSFTNYIPNIDSLSLSQENLTNLDGTYTSSIYGYFNLISSASVVGYSVYYSTDKGVTWNFLTTTIDGTFTMGVATGQNYCFKIITMGINGEESTGYVSEPMYITGKTDPPSDVTGGMIIYSRDSFNVTLSWSKSSNLDFKYFELQDANHNVITTTENTEYIINIPDSNTHEYYVYAVNRMNIKSENPLKFIVQRDIVCAVPTNLTITQDKTDLTQITISWDAITSEYLASYKVYVNNELVTTTTNTNYPYTISKSGDYVIGVCSYSVYGKSSEQTTKKVTLNIENTTI